MTRTTLIDFNPDENSQGLRYYPFMVNLDRCHENCKIPDLSGRTCVPNKTEDVNLSVFNLITRINESKTLAKHISCKCNCKLHCKKYNSNQKLNNDKCLSECKNTKKHCVCEYHTIYNILYIKYIFGSLAHVFLKVLFVIQ